MTDERTWTQCVNEVFSARPRDGSTSETVWSQREEEADLAQYLEASGVHVCVDGPTGSGKSSLVETVLNRNKVRHCFVQLVDKMEWEQLCALLLGSPKAEARAFAGFSTKRDWEVGFNVGWFRAKVGEEISRLSYAEQRARAASMLTEHDICEAMAKNNIALFLDDVHMASGQLINRVANMGRLLTQSYEADNAKLVVVGAGDIFPMLIEARPDLIGRVEEITLGGFKEKWVAWTFIHQGLRKLGVRTPVEEHGAGRLSRAEVNKCYHAVSEAVDGLPKAINELGRAICRHATGGRRVSPRSIIRSAELIPRKYAKAIGQKQPKAMITAEGDPVVRDLLEILYQRDVSAIHDWGDISAALSKRWPDEQVDNAILQLVEIGFLARTGLNRERLFAPDPVLAYTMGVVCSFPKKYGAPRGWYGQSRQLCLAFLKRSAGEPPVDVEGVDQ